jgi:hypothetical protein
MLGFWLAMRWTEKRNPGDILWSQLALLTAALFRLEAATFFLALMAWQMTTAMPGGRLRAALVSVSLPVGVLMLSALLVLAGAIEFPNRVWYYLSAADPILKSLTLSDAAAKLSDTVLPYKYSREEAIYILLIGLLAIIPVKFFKMMGLLLIPFIYRFRDGDCRKVLEPWQPLPWAFAMYVLVLAAFVTHQMFLVGRYVSMLNLLAVPVVAVGFAQLAGRFPRWRPVMIGLFCIMAVANAVSLSPRQTHILEAGKWLALQSEKPPHACVNNSRIAYYAGWPLNKVTNEENIPAMLAKRQCDVVAIEVRHGAFEAALAALDSRGFGEIRRFVGTSGDAVVVAVSRP